MAKILIAGCGATGGAVAGLLVDDGHAVYGLRRRPPADNQGISFIRADLSHPDDLSALDTDFDLVIYMLSPDDRSELAYRKVFEHGVKNLLEVFRPHRSDAAFIFVSSTSVYGQSHGEWVDESSVTEPERSTARVILEAERAFLAEGRRSCVIRFSGIYGRSKSRLLDAVISNREVQYQPPYYMNRIHWQDCVAVTRLVADKMIAGEALEPVYLASDDVPAPKWEVFSYLAGRLGVEPPAKAVMPEDTPQNKRCSNRRLKQLGYRFKYPGYRDGYADVTPADIGD